MTTYRIEVENEDAADREIIESRLDDILSRFSGYTFGISWMTEEEAPVKVVPS